jgi:hypothetical protein
MVVRDELAVARNLAAGVAERATSVCVFEERTSAIRIPNSMRLTFPSLAHSGSFRNNSVLSLAISGTGIGRKILFGRSYQW